MLNFLSVDGLSAAYVADIVVVLIVLISVLHDAKKGFIGCVFGLIISVVSLAVAFFCAETVCVQTDGLFGLQTFFTENITEMLSGIEILNSPLAGTDIAAVLSEANLPEFLVELIVDTLAIENAVEGTTLAVEVGKVVGEFATFMVAGLVLFLLCRILLTLTEKLFTKAVASIKVFGFINSVLGAAIGFLKAALIVLLVLAALSIFPNENITGFFNQTLFVGYLYNHNPINQIFALIFGS